MQYFAWGGLDTYEYFKEEEEEIKSYMMWKVKSFLVLETIFVANQMTAVVFYTVTVFYTVNSQSSLFWALLSTAA